MDILICLLAIFGLAFLLKESDGPWGIIGWFRNKIVNNSVIGVFSYQLLSCYFCLGFHCGWIVYLLTAEHYRWQFFILWGLAGGVISLILDGLLERLHRE